MSALSHLQKLLHYQYKDAAASDIDNASKAYRSLRLHLNNYTFDTGQTSRLLCLDGTLPVTYFGSQYNIPIAIYFVPNHPHSPPIAYVRPTATMQIKPGKNVDANGKIYLPYLSEWKFPGSSTSQLLSMLQEIFGTQSPVFSKSTAANKVAAGVGFSAFATGLVQDGMPGSGWGKSGSPGAVMPGLPGSTASPSPRHGASPYYGGVSGAMPSLPAVASSPYVQSTATAAAGALSSIANEEEALLSSLKSAVLDKIYREQQELGQMILCEVQSLEATQTDLYNHRSTLDTYQAQMASEMQQVRAATRELEEKTKEYGDAYKQLKKEADGSTDYDSVVDTTTPVYRQLLKAFAEEQAIDDLLYYLTQAHEKGAIGSDDFLKAVRDQSRKQFMLRATVTLCRDIAGLPPV